MKVEFINMRLSDLVFFSKTLSKLFSLIKECFGLIWESMFSYFSLNLRFFIELFLLFCRVLFIFFDCDFFWLFFKEILINKGSIVENVQLLIGFTIELYSLIGLNLFLLLFLLILFSFLIG